jgi:hypothetical protein
VLAIDTGCRPGKLERHDRQKEDKKELFHCVRITRWWAGQLDDRLAADV